MFAVSEAPPIQNLFPVYVGVFKVKFLEE